MFAMRPTAPAKPRPFDELDHKLIVGVHDHYLITAELLTLLYFKLGTKTTVQEHLPGLVKRRYLRYFPLRTTKGNGSHVYYLGTKGIEHCMDAGYDMDTYYLPKKAKEPSYPVLVHTLELNTYLAYAAAFARTNGMDLAMQHDFSLRKQPVKVTLPTQVEGRWVDEAHTISADAFLTFQLPDGSKRWFWHEHDTGEESQKQVKQHLRGILAFLMAEGYKTAFGAGGVTITYATAGKRDRVEHLRTWTRDVLLERDHLVKAGAFGTAFSNEAGKANLQRSYAQYFLFTRVPPLLSARIDTNILFTQPVWYPPFGLKPTALFHVSHVL